MNWEEKKEKLQKIYDRFEQDVGPLKKDAVCCLGCTFCCTQVGNVDINTLEGLVIHERLMALPRVQRRGVLKKLATSRKRKQKQSMVRCAFLTQNGACLIYEARPFSCRQLYSLQPCDGRGPTIHKQAVARAKKAVRKMQELDDTGYSGHISYVLHLLDNEGFRKSYLKGHFDPSQIMDFGKRFGIVINRYMTRTA